MIKKLGLSFILHKQLLSMFNRARYRQIYNATLSHLYAYNVGSFKLAEDARPLPFIPLTKTSTALLSVLPFNNLA